MKMVVGGILSNSSMITFFFACQTMSRRILFITWECDKKVMSNDIEIVDSFFWQFRMFLTSQKVKL